MAAVPSVPKATMKGADMNARYLTFNTPLTFMSWGERIIVGFIPHEQGVTVEVSCATKGMPNLMQNGLTARSSSSSSTRCPASCR